MSDYYYENNILPPDIHFRKPRWLKKPKTAKESKFEDDKALTPSGTATCGSMEDKEPAYPVKTGIKNLTVKEDESDYLRPKEKRKSLRNKRSMSTSFSFCADGRKGEETLSPVFAKASNLMQTNNQMHFTPRNSGNTLSPFFYSSPMKEVKGKFNHSGSLKGMRLLDIHSFNVLLNNIVR